MEACCTSQETALRELERRAPNAPFLALGQTVLWDEPMKASVILSARRLGFDRAFVAGVHDTDYFAKAPGKAGRGGYQAFTHNDTTTRGLWSAAGEFSALFGSETVVTRERLHSAGAKLSRVSAERPGVLDEITEAWGWRGVVSLSEDSKTAAETPLAPLADTLLATFDWAIDRSLEQMAICQCRRHPYEEAADRLRSAVREAAEADPNQTLTEFYRRLLPTAYSMTAGEPVEIETATTSELLRFNTATCGLPRFDLLDLFVRPETRAAACQAYDDSVRHAEVYTLDRFGVGALPFDLVIPGHGRGTLRLGTRGGVVMTPERVGFTIRKPLRNARDLAEVIEARFGPNCVLVGKAVTLIGMLAREYVFVFHEEGSMYVRNSRAMHKRLAEAGYPLELNPILRVRYSPWDAMGDCCAWIRLGEPLRRPFGVDELSAATFSSRWREVAYEQRKRLIELGNLKRPLELLGFLDRTLRGCWSCLASEYQAIHEQMLDLRRQLDAIAGRKRPLLDALNRLKAERVAAEEAKGRHWRESIFEKNAAPGSHEERLAHVRNVNRIIEQQKATRKQLAALRSEQEALVHSEEADHARDRRKELALEAELTRLRLIREAVIATEGLEHAGHRPSAWWFPLVCPDGSWFRGTAERAEFYLEELV